MSRSSVGPLKLTSGGSNSSAHVPPPPLAKKKSLGVRKHHVAGGGGGGLRYQLPITNGNSITTFFKKSTSEHAINQLQSASQSPACSQDCSPPTAAGSLFAETTRFNKEEMTFAPFTSSPLPSFDALPAAATSAMWDSTPPTDLPTIITCAAFSAATRPPPSAPSRAPKKSIARSLPETTHPLRSLLAPDDDDEDLATSHTEESDSADNIIPFKLNLCSQPTQPETDRAPQSFSQLQTQDRMDDDSDALMVAQPPAPERSSSSCSDIVIQASQDEEDALPVTADDFLPLEDGSKSTPASRCSTPKLAPAPSPAQTPSASPSATSIDNNMLSFRAFNDSLPQRANASVNPFALQRPTTEPPPSSIPDKRPLVARTAALSRTNSFTQHAASQGPRPVRQASFSGSQSGGLPPPAPRPAPSSQSFLQTTLHHLIRANSNLNSISMSQESNFPGFAASQNMSQTQRLPAGGLSSTQQSAGNSLESYPSNSMFCTPQDQPVRERTALEMSEELFLQREQVAWDHATRTAGGPPPQLTNTHQPLTAAMRNGSSNGSNGFLAPPAMKKARFTMTSGGPGLESLQSLGSTLPPDEQQLEIQRPSQQQQQHGVRPRAPLVNPFLQAAEAVASRAAATVAGPAVARASKKRGLGDANTAIAPSFPMSASSTSRLFTEFEYLKQFGLGCYGIVFQVRHRLDGLLYAVKKSKGKVRGVNSEKLMMREVQVLGYFKGQTCVPRSILRYDTSWVEEGHLYIQTEWCKGGSLANIMKKFRGGTATTAASSFSTSFAHADSSSAPPAPFSSGTLLLIALQMSQALAFMHSHQLVHLDVKPDNIFEFKADCEYRLGDFGLSCSASDGSSAVLAVGDKRYLPGEALEDDIQDLRAVDLFALGCTLYELASGVPFELPMSQMEMTRIRHGDIDDVAHVLDPLLYELIRSLLHSDPTQRRCAADLVEMLECRLQQTEMQDDMQRPQSH